VRDLVQCRGQIPSETQAMDSEPTGQKATTGGAFWKAQTRRGKAVLVAVLATVAVGGTVAYQLYSEVEQRRLEVAIMSQADRGLYLYQMFNFGKLPAASRPCQGHPPERGFSWLVEILPYIEGVNLTMLIDFNQPWDGPANEQVRACKFKPQSSDPKMWAFRFDRGPDATEASPIVGIAGLGADAASLPLQDPRVGVFGYGRQLRLSDITDGLSTTMMVVTTDRLSGHWMAGGNATIRGVDPSQKPYIGSTRQFGRRGGAAVVFADGSVRWISSSVDDRLFEAMATIHGGESTPELDAIPIAMPSQRSIYDRARP
jgi:hypothetical protein